MNLRQVQAHSVDVESDANVATNAGELRVDKTLADYDGRDFEGAVGLEEVERVGIKRRFRDLQVSCRIIHRKVPDTVKEAEELAEEPVKEVKS